MVCTSNPPGRVRPLFTPDMETTELAKVLGVLGCPEQKVGEMASQLRKRAKQLAEQTGRTEDEALAHLLALMQQGWAAQEKGL